MDPKVKMTCVFVTRGEDVERHIHKRGPCDDRGRDQGNVGVS